MMFMKCFEIYKAVTTGKANLNTCHLGRMLLCRGKHPAIRKQHFISKGRGLV